MSDLGLLPLWRCEQIDEDRVFSLPAAIPVPDLRLSERFAYCSTPLIEMGHFSFRLLAEASRKRRVEPIPEADAHGDPNMLEAIHLTNAALAAVAGDYRAEACARFHEGLKLILGNANTPEALLAYLPCLSAINATLINFTYERDGKFILTEIAEADRFSDDERLATWNAFDLMLGKVGVLLHFCRWRFLPTADMSLSEAMPIKAWWQDVLRVSKRMRSTRTPDFDAEPANRGGAKRLRDVVHKSMLALDKELEAKRYREPHETICPVVEINGEIESDDIPAEPVGKIETKVECALRTSRRGEDFEVREVVDAEAIKTDVGLRKAAGEGWSPTHLQTLGGGLIVRRLRSAVFERLAEDFPHAEKLLTDLARSLRIHEAFGRKVFTLPRPILLVGEPGVGKTFLARTIAQRSELPYRVVPLGGADSKSVAGSHRSWSQSVPSAPVQAMVARGVDGVAYANTVLVFDEVDKASTDSRMNPLGAMLPMLEKSTARVYQDQFLLATVDISEVIYILTANSLAALPAPLLSRCDIYQLRPPKRDQYPAIIHGVRRDFAAELGVDERFLPAFDADDLEFLCNAPEIRDIRTLVAVTRRILEHRAIQPHEQGAFH
jgi:ATP-dependent Lon protease